MQTRNVLPNDNLYYSVLLSLDEGKSYGSGFRLKYNNCNYLTTARHVLFDENYKLRATRLIMTCQNANNNDEPVILSIDLEKAYCKYDKINDIAIIKLAEFKKLYSKETPLKYEKKEQKRPTQLLWESYLSEVSLPVNARLVSLDKEATRGLNEIKIGNDVFLMGYPTSLGMKINEDFDSSKPLLRKGIIAGIHKNTFIIDCPTYFGNSGGPIVEYGEDGYYRIIGIVSKYIPFVTKWYSNREHITNTELTNSGYTVCVPIQTVFDLIDKQIE
ncbi:trypsin-like peptidase domain-containing protein [Flavobacterium sp. FlaQc-57]|uniref:trypsin-like peptidase domain-containing protein n=1 Tax=Flavobacterium sp. FlaQc-57 TaxID=3374186 RepID=UPI003757D536